MKLISLALSTSLVALPLVLSVLSSDASARKHGHKLGKVNHKRKAKKHLNKKKKSKMMKKKKHHNKKRAGVKKRHPQRAGNGKKNLRSPTSSLSAAAPSATGPAGGIALQSLFSSPSSSFATCPKPECRQEKYYNAVSGPCWANNQGHYCAQNTDGTCQLEKCRTGMFSVSHPLFNKCKPNILDPIRTGPNSCPLPNNRDLGLPSIFQKYKNQVPPTLDLTCDAACKNNPNYFDNRVVSLLSLANKGYINLESCSNKDLANTCYCRGTTVALNFNQRDSCGYFKVIHNW